MIYVVNALFCLVNVFVGSKQNELVRNHPSKENILFIIEGLSYKVSKNLQKLIAKGIAMLLINQVKAFKICLDDGMIGGITA